MKRIIFVLLTILICHYGAVGQAERRDLTIGKSIVLHSHILNEDRKINIYLPNNYVENDTLTYPVVYVLDGGMDEDFFHIVGIVRFDTQPWIARFPNSIVVGIEGNTRRRDFTFAVPNIDFLEKEGFQKASFPAFGGSQKYITFLKDELLPYIGKHYKTKAERTVIGESLAGLFSAELLLKQPDLFDNYIIISPSLWWGQQELLKNSEKLLDANLRKKVRVYLGVPNKEEDLKMYQDAEAFYNILRKHKKTAIIFDYMAEELHSTVIHQAVYNAFRQLYSKTAYSK
ncbi:MULTISPECIES: alpha/beta hydrolase [unclassified Sphingobacterium]|uniref:alpha/beta hydrolase n=1 Tax=unclassified Sphingobacterium TaxID=2609468 RepID=UPI0025D72B3D|nr:MULTISPECIES: alpha/beta hydrolase-fold protein [unclassified Sphingobacterium]